MASKSVAVCLVFFVAFFIGCQKDPTKPEDQAWPNKTKATLSDGTQVVICVYDQPLDDGGFVVNVIREDDPPGRCWGTIIYPKPIN
jgi:hypothetical protein